MGLSWHKEMFPGTGGGRRISVFHEHHFIIMTFFSSTGIHDRLLPLPLTTIPLQSNTGEGSLTRPSLYKCIASLQTWLTRGTHVATASSHAHSRHCLPVSNICLLLNVDTASESFLIQQFSSNSAHYMSLAFERKAI